MKLYMAIRTKPPIPLASPSSSQDKVESLDNSSEPRAKDADTTPILTTHLMLFFATVRHNVFALLHPCPVLCCAALPHRLQRLKSVQARAMCYRDPVVFPPPVKTPEPVQIVTVFPCPSLPRRTERTPSPSE
ncbi:hypothetical protein QX201_006850 [Fusarium graminearum]